METADRAERLAEIELQKAEAEKEMLLMDLDKRRQEQKQREEQERHLGSDRIIVATPPCGCHNHGRNSTFFAWLEVGGTVVCIVAIWYMVRMYKKALSGLG